MTDKALKRRKATGSGESGPRAEWLRPRWESEFTAFKDCDSSLGAWNDPPALRAPAGQAPRVVRVGKGKLHLLADASIAAFQPLFEGWRGRRVAVLLDETLRDRHWELAFNVSGLVHRHLFGAGIPCLRLHPSEASGFVDENRLFFWPVATTGLDAIIWIATTPISARMKSLLCRAPLRQFLERGGELYLGGQAHAYVPYLEDAPTIEQAWLGVQNLQVYGDLRGRISSAAARLELRRGTGEPLGPVGWRVLHLEHGYMTRAEYGEGLSLEARVSFLATDRLAIEWVVGNAGAAGREVGIRVAGDFAGKDQELVSLKQEGGRLSVDVSRRVAFPSWLHMTAGPQVPRWEIDGQAYCSEFPTVTVPPGGRERGALTMTLSIGDAAAGQAPPAIPAELGGSWAAAEARWERAFLAVCRGVARGGTAERMARRALVTTLHNTWRPPAALAGNKFGARRVVQVQRLHYPLWAPYEAGFYGIGARNFDAALARDQVAVFVSLQRADGWIPLVVGNRFAMDMEGISQAPTLAFAAWQIHREEPHRGFLEEVYPGLCRIVEWWDRNRQPRRDGLFGFWHAQEGAGDDHPRADLPSGELRRGMRRFISPDACGFMLMEMRCLARIARELGRAQKAATWEARATALGRRTVEVCLCAEDNMLWDVSLETGAFERCLSPWHFTPLWAGAPLEPEQARAMIREHMIGRLLDGPVPLPIVDPRHPAYLSDAYWRGPSWPQLWPLALQTLWWYGFEREADETADRLVRLCAGNPFIMEIYDSRSGQGLSLPEYSFAATALLDIIPRRYRDEPPWRPP